MSANIRIDKKMIAKTLSNEWAKAQSTDVTLVITSDRLANDPLISQLIEMTAPITVKKSIIRTMDRAIHILQGENVKLRPYYFIVDNIDDVETLCAAGHIDEINVALITSKGDDVVKVNDLSTVTREEADRLKALGEKGIKLYTQYSYAYDPVDLKDVL